MDSSHPVWRSGPMQDALARGDPGAVVRLARRAAEVSLTEVGRAVGYTASSLSRMERGRQPMRDVELLQRLAAFLNIPPQMLGVMPRHEGMHAVGLAPTAPTAGTKVGPPTTAEEESMRRRRLLTGMTGLVATAAVGPAHAASIEHARHINPKSLPTERAARYWIDVARSYGQWGKHSDCYQALTYAAEAAPQEVRRTSVHALTRDLLPHARALPGLRAFATRTGALT